MYCHDNIISTEEIPMDEELLGGIGWVMFKNMKKNGPKIAEMDVSTGKSNTFGTLLQNCVRTSIKLRKMGVNRKDIVTYFSEAHLNACVPMVASLMIGAIPSFIDAALPAIEVGLLLNHVTPKLIFTDRQYLEKLEDIVKDTQSNTKIVLFDENFFEKEKDEDDFSPIYVTDLKELAIIYFSSGSTGLPKGICTNHYNLLCLDLCEDGVYIQGQQKVIHSYDSFYWTVEMMRLLESVTHGACRLISSKEFDPQKIWFILEKYQVNVFHLTAFQLTQMCKIGKPEDVNLNSLTTIYSQGAHLYKEYELELRAMLPNTNVYQLYGQTETGEILKVFKNDLHKAYRNKVGCNGMPMIGSGNSYKIVDLSSKQRLGPNQEGELYVKSKTIMLGYYNLDSSDRFDEEGWLKTGDLAYYDEDFCFFITGRCKELIIYQGWHIMPNTFENVLESFPGVVRAVVIGIPHIEDGERPVGLVMVDSDFFSNVNEIERYMEVKIPNRSIKIKIVEQIPTTVTGKVKRAEVKEKFMKGDI